MATDDSAIYCLRCKRFTPNVQTPEPDTASNGRAMLRAQCTECRGAKSRFTSTPK